MNTRNQLSCCCFFVLNSVLYSLVSINCFTSFTYVIFVLDGEFKLLYEPFHHFPVPRHHGLVEWRKSGPVGRQDVLLPVQQLFDVTQVLGLYRLVQFCHFSLSMHDYLCNPSFKVTYMYMHAGM